MTEIGKRKLCFLGASISLSFLIINLVVAQTLHVELLFCLVLFVWIVVLIKKEEKNPVYKSRY